MGDEEMAVDERYAKGLRLLEQCNIAFDLDLYEQAVNILMEVYNTNHDQALWELLFAIIYKPNMSDMQIRYQANKQYLSDVYQINCFPDYLALKIMLFPVTNRCIRIFDCDKALFLGRDAQNRLYHLYYHLIFDDLNELKKADYIQKFFDEQKGIGIWRKLQKALDSCQFTDEMMALAKQYHQLCPVSEKYDLFLAEYHYQQANYLQAELSARRAHKVRKVNYDVCIALAKCYAQNGKYEAAAALYITGMKCVVPDLTESVLEGVFVELIQIIEKAKAVSENRALSVQQAINIRYTPVRVGPFIIGINLASKRPENSHLCGEFIYEQNKEYCYFVGIYNPDNELSAGAALMDILKNRHEPIISYYSYTYHILLSNMANKRICAKGAVPYIVPIAATTKEQKITFRFSGMEKSIVLGKFVYSNFRIDEDVEVFSDQPMVFGKPIYLQHSPKRRKFILSILLDAFSWGKAKEGDFSDIPNMMKFFKKGTIFNHNYSAAEYTFASVPTIECGAYQPKVQIFDPSTVAEIDRSFKTTTEHMQKKGYYCIHLRARPEGFYSQCYRGSDCMILNVLEKGYVGVERTIRYLKAFSETDVYMHLHLDDVHPFYDGFQMEIESQNKLNLAERINPNADKSVNLPYTPARAYQYKQALQNADRVLGTLFDFIEDHYQDDEFIVNLYADHGVSIFSEKPYVLSELQSCSALMMRGFAIPQNKFVDDEVTSSIDLYKILSSLEEYSIDDALLDCALPKAFGGEGRKYTYSNSLYPNQTYKLCIRDFAYEFRLETEEPVSYDGRVNMDKICCQLYTRDEEHKRIYDDDISKRFLEEAYKFTASIHQPQAYFDLGR